MDHSPTPEEQEAIDYLLERFAFEFVTIRLTTTMLEKSIIDAGESLRFLLKKTGIVEYAALPPEGAEYGATANLPIVFGAYDEMRRVSFYRPKTKSGDPRLWISGLKQLAGPGQLLLAAFSGASVAFVLLSGTPESLVKGLGRYFPTRDSEFSRLSIAIAKIETKVRELAERGWLRTLRGGDTGIGYTFETILGIPANVRQGADLDGVEIKTHRTGGRTRSDPLITLFSKTPAWGRIGGSLGLVKEFGYEDSQRERRALYCSICATPNSLGWYLEVDPDLGRVNVCHGAEPILYYTLEVLHGRLEEKHRNTLFISAQARGSGASEEFLYNRVSHSLSRTVLGGVCRFGS